MVGGWVIICVWYQLPFGGTLTVHDTETRINYDGCDQLITALSSLLLCWCVLSKRVFRDVFLMVTKITLVRYGSFQKCDFIRRREKCCPEFSLKYTASTTALYSLTSVSIFSILFSVYFHRYWQGEFFKLFKLPTLPIIFFILVILMNVLL